MRVTNNMMVSTLLRNLSNNAQRLNGYQAQLSSEMRINKLSDDPLGVVTSLRARNSRANLEMYQLNLDSAFSWMEAGETALMDMNTILQDIYELSIDAATDAKTSADRKIMANKVAEFRDQIIQTLNATLADKYVFGGYNNLVQPFVQKNGSIYYNGYRMDASDVTELNFEQFQADVASALEASVSAITGTTAQDALDQLSAAGGALADMITAAQNASNIRDASAQDMLDAMKIIRDDLATTTYGGGTPEDLAIVGAMDALLATVQDAIDAGIDTSALKKNLTQTQTAIGDIQKRAENVTGTAAADVVAEIQSAKTEYDTEAAEAVLYPAKLLAEGEKKYEVEVGYGLRLDVCMNGVDVMGLGDKNIFTILDELYNALIADYVDPSADPMYFVNGMTSQLNALLQSADPLVDPLANVQADASQLISRLDGWLKLGEDEAVTQGNIAGKLNSAKIETVLEKLRSNIDSTWTAAEKDAASEFISMAEAGLRAGMTLEGLGSAIKEVRSAYADADTAINEPSMMTTAQLQALGDTLEGSAAAKLALSGGGAVSGSIATDITPFISRLQGGQKEVLALTSIFGARVNRCEILQARYEIDFINYTSRISNVEDIDTAETIMWFKMAESVYNAALSAGARVIQPSLMDFLR